MLRHIGLEQLRDIRDEWIIRIWISQQGTDRQQNLTFIILSDAVASKIDDKRAAYLGYRQSWRPLIFEDVQANATIRIDITMINSSSETNFRWFEGIICRKVNIKEENAARVW
jgi:hypothetical protein